MLVRVSLVIVTCMILVMPTLAQEGHPLVGSWHGDWGPTPDSRRDITVIMDWDGTTLTGLVNPGFEHSSLENARLNSSDWTTHFEIDFEDASGAPMRCTVDGTIGSLGSDRRTLSGSWNCGDGEAEFQIIRDRDY
jgi:hypothetical protein